MGNCCRQAKYFSRRSNKSSQNPDKDKVVATGCPSSSSPINSPVSLPPQTPPPSKFRQPDLRETLFPNQNGVGKTDLDPGPPAESEDSWMSAELITTPFKREAGSRKTDVFIPPLSLDFVHQSALQVLKQSPSQPWIETPESTSNRRDEIPLMSLSSSSSAGLEPGSFHSRLEITGLSAFGVSSEASKEASLLNKTLHAETSRMIGFSPTRKRRGKPGSESHSADLANTSLPLVPTTDIPEKAESKFHLKTALLQFDRISEELTQTHRPITMTKIKFTGTISVVVANGETRLNDYLVQHQLHTDEKGTWYAARSETYRVTIWEYNKTDLSLRPTCRAGTALDALYKQVRLLDRVQHPSVLQLLEVIDDSENETGYFVYEDVRLLITSAELSETRVKSAFRQLTEAVAYLHDVLDIVHLSIRPEALFLTEKGDVKLADFSMARSGKESEDTRRWRGQKIDDPGWSGKRNLGPPQGKPVDIWDCGSTLYRLLFGKMPFPGLSEASFPQISKERWGIYKLQIPEGTSPGLESLLRGMLETDAHKRLTISEVLQHPWVL